MKTIDEKEKKLAEVLNQLKNLELIGESQTEELDLLKSQKNQLEIEKKELEEKYLHLQDENLKLNDKFEEFKKKDVEEKKKRRSFFRKNR